MIYETRRLLNAREIVRIVGKGHVAFFPAWYFNYFRDICISSLRISRDVKYQIPIKFPTQIYQIACYKFDQILVEMEMQKSVRNVEKCTFLLHLETWRADIIQRPSSTRHV